MSAFPCTYCGRPCANGTGRSAHERHCPEREGGICPKCHDEYPRGELAQHLQTCPQSATATTAKTHTQPSTPRGAQPTTSTNPKPPTKRSPPSGAQPPAPIDMHVVIDSEQRRRVFDLLEAINT